jgi:hypothetical protein
VNKYASNLLNVRKGVAANYTYGEDDLWPTPTGNTSLSTRGFVNYLLFNNSPSWLSLTGLQSLFDWYHINPIFYAVVNIKAREYANMRVLVQNRYTGEIEDPVKTRKVIPRKLYDMFDQPNVMQARGEFFRQRKIFLEVAGNSMTYANSAIGFKPNINTLTALWNVWPAYMKFKLGGKYFEATEIKEVIKAWEFELGLYKKTWEPHEIMHINIPNTNPMDGLIFGRSPAASLIRPLSNIDMAYESRNVIMRNRGMRVIMSSDKGDASGNTSLTKDEEEAVQKVLAGYGTLDGQKQFLFTPAPIKAVPIDQDVMKLGLFEEIATDAMTVCNAYGVPEVLLKLYIKGATFENQEASVRRLYQGTLIPEAEDEMKAWNKFLGLNETEWLLVPSFEHVAVLQTSRKESETADKAKSDRLINEFKSGLITLEEFRNKMEYGDLPKPVIDPNAPPSTGADTKTLDAQAALRGSVGGVQGVLAIQTAVTTGTTTFESALSILTIIYGFSEEDAKNILGQPKPQGDEQPTETEQTTIGENA